MRVLPAAPAGVTLLVAAGCAGTTEPASAVQDVAPLQAYNDQSVALSIRGGPFRPAYEIDTRTGKSAIAFDAFRAFLVPSDASDGGTRVPVDGLTWQESTALGGTLAMGIAPALYDLELHDPRGNVVVHPKTFRSLGPDKDKPMVYVLAPVAGSVVAANTTVPVLIRADDGVGHLASIAWSLLPAGTSAPSSPCQLDPGASHADCPSSFVAPMPSQLVQPLSLVATATDSVGLRGTFQVDFSVALPPVVSSFDPKTGPSSGGTVIVVQGDNFIAGGTQILIDGIPVSPNGGMVQSQTVIRGTTPVHDDGTVPVVVRTGQAEVRAGDFTYVASPRVKDIAPAMGPSAGFTYVAVVGDHFRNDQNGQTGIYFGKISRLTALQCPVFKSEHRIEGFTPPGMGNAPVIADDPVAPGAAGTTTFFYLDPPRDGGAGGVPDGGPTTMKCAP